MEQIEASKPEIKLVGIQVRTNNKIESRKLEGNIFPIVQRYFHQGLGEQILNRSKPGTTYCAYTDYESDHTGDYTYFIGEEVSSFDAIPDGFKTLTIPEQKYTKFTNGPAPMPNVIMDAWQEIWSMTPEDLGGERRYHTDFEIYDERAADHENIVLDVYIGLK